MPSIHSPKPWEADLTGITTAVYNVLNTTKIEQQLLLPAEHPEDLIFAAPAAFSGP